MKSILKRISRNLSENSLSYFYNPNQTITYIESITPSTLFDEHHTIYIGELNDDIISRPLYNVNLLLYSDEPAGSITLPDKCNVFIIFDKDEFKRIEALIYEAFNDEVKLNRINSELLNMVKATANLQKIMDYAALVLSNPVLLVDVSFVYVASAGAKSFPEQANWQHTLDTGVMPSDYLQRIMHSEIPYLDSECTDNEIIIGEPDDENKYRTYSIRTTSNRNLLGYFKILAANRDVTTFDIKALSLINEYIGLVYGESMRRKDYSNSMAESFLSSVLLRKVDSSKAIEGLKDVFSLKLYHNLQVILVDLTGSLSKEDTPYYILKKLRGLFLNHIVVLVNSNIVILYDSQDDVGLSSGLLFNQFKTMLKENGCVAYFSFIFSSLDEVYRYYEQALFCKKYKQMTGNSEIVTFYKDVYEYQMIASIDSQVDIRSIIHPALRKLYNIDKKNGSNLVQTLIAYVNNHLSLTATSKEMFVHYNTLKHRIQKIVEYTDFDESNSNEIFRIMLSEKILSMYGWSYLE